MKLRELFEDTALQFRTDNPGGKWLSGHIESVKSSGKNRYGGPARLGPVTGYFSRTVLLPVELVSKLPGINGEHNFTREDSFEYLKQVMSETGKFPFSKDRQYFPFITIDQDGKPWISEGNHRIKVAKALDWKYIPVEVRYFTGGEEADGLLTPEKIKNFDTKGHSLGYKTGNDFQGEL
jgi:hypothetical protein